MRPEAMTAAPQFYLPLDSRDGTRSGRSISEQFDAFHEAHPGVYWELVRLLERAKEKGRSRIGIGMLWEVLRWQTMLGSSDETWKLNNNYRSRYARLIRERRPDLGALLETRELRSA